MLKDLILRNRSYRSFVGGFPVGEEQLREMVECARFSASSINIQPLKFKLVYEPEEADTLFKLTGWARALPNLKLPPEGHHPTAFIVICHDLSIHNNPQAYWKDVGIVAQSMMLSAVEMGLGGCMIGNFSAEKVSAALHFPETIVPQLILALGKPDDKIVLTTPDDSGNVKYYREDGVHYVPKRSLEELILP